jgi:hypothetical protein
LARASGNILLGFLQNYWAMCKWTAAMQMNHLLLREIVRKLVANRSSEGWWPKAQLRSGIPVSALLLMGKYISIGPRAWRPWDVIVPKILGLGRRCSLDTTFFAEH